MTHEFELSAMRTTFRAMLFGGLLAAPLPLVAQQDTVGYTASECPPCAEWNAPRRPFRIFGNTWYVGTDGLGALLVTSDAGHVLLDGGLPESAPLIAANIQAVGFRLEDIRLIVNSHAHYDHAGGIAVLQRLTGARVAASDQSAPVLRRGKPGPDDPQFEIALPYPPVVEVQVFEEGDTLRVGLLTLVPHRTAGHTPGGTTWSWESCDAGRCVVIVYADSQTPVSADSFRFTSGDRYPAALADFERGFAQLETMRCDLLVTPHPGASQLFERAAGARNGPALIDPGGCRRYAAAARRQLARRIARERAGR